MPVVNLYSWLKTSCDIVLGNPVIWAAKATKTITYHKTCVLFSRTHVSYMRVIYTRWNGKKHIFKNTALCAKIVFMCTVPLLRYNQLSFLSLWISFTLFPFSHLHVSHLFSSIGLWDKIPKLSADTHVCEQCHYQWVS